MTEKSLDNKGRTCDLERKTQDEVWSRIIQESKFQGTVGKRQVFENLMVLTYRTWSSNFGRTDARRPWTAHFYIFCDESNNAFAYFASHDMNLSVGQVVSLRATVKKHELRALQNGDASYSHTVLTICSKVVSRKKSPSLSLVPVQDRTQGKDLSAGNSL